MNLLEKDLEEIIYATEVEKLNEKGLYVNGKVFRQKRIGNYGIADLIYVQKEYRVVETINKKRLRPYLNIQVCELKKEKAGISAFLQAIKYCKGISRYLRTRNYYDFKFEIILIAPKIETSSDYIYLTDLITSNQIGCIYGISNYSVSITIDGLEFKSENDYRLIDEGFNNEKI